MIWFPTKQQMYGHLPPIMKTIQVRRTIHAGYSWRSRVELISDLLQWSPSHGQLEPTYSSSVRIRVVALGTYWKRWTIGRDGERGSGISMLIARQDDDDDRIKNADDYKKICCINSEKLNIMNKISIIKNCCDKIIYYLIAMEKSMIFIATFQVASGQIKSYGRRDLT